MIVINLYWVSEFSSQFLLVLICYELFIDYIACLDEDNCATIKPMSQ